MKKKRFKRSIIIALALAFSLIMPNYSIPSRSSERNVPAERTIYESANFKVQAVGMRTMVICKKCYNYNAKLVCNHSTIYSGTYTHGNCTYILYRSTANFKCSECGANELFDNGLHDCVQSHTGCGLGRVSICGIE